MFAPISQKIISEDLILKYIKHKNHFDSHNSINFNKLDNFYYIHIRHNNFNDKRMTQLIKTKDFKTFLSSKLVDINYKYNYDIYNLNVSKMDEYNCFMAFPNYAINESIKDINNKIINVKKKFVKDLLISKDGIKTLPEPAISTLNFNIFGSFCLFLVFKSSILPSLPIILLGI